MPAPQGALNQAVGLMESGGQTLNGNNPSFSDNVDPTYLSLEGILSAVLDTTSSTTPCLRFTVVN